ncbi:Uncharacterised protein [Chlamydia trachomatis]|nr:Uncharacterised protein [Chlamydia trachomatis]
MGVGGGDDATGDHLHSHEGGVVALADRLDIRDRCERRGGAGSATQDRRLGRRGLGLRLGLSRMCGGHGLRGRDGGPPIGGFAAGLTGLDSLIDARGECPGLRSALAERVCGRSCRAGGGLGDERSRRKDEGGDPSDKAVQCCSSHFGIPFCSPCASLPRERNRNGHQL